MSDFWAKESSEVDAFVELRGEIAHRGSDARSVSRTEAIHFKSLIAQVIVDMDSGLYEYLKQPSLLGGAPWQRTHKN